MKKIVVFDSGWGGEMVADFLAHELQTIEVIRVIDWRNAPYGNKNYQLVFQLVEEGIKPYLNRVDAIVLGGYACSVVYPGLQRKFPDQNFVPMQVDFFRLLQSRSSNKNICALMNKVTAKSEINHELRQKLPNSNIIIPDSCNWDQLIDDGEMQSQIMVSELGKHFILRNGANLSQSSNTEPDLSQPAMRADVVLLMDTHLWDVKSEIERLFGWGTRVLDSKNKLLHDVCAALKLRGVDGKRNH